MLPHAATTSNVPAESPRLGDDHVLVEVDVWGDLYGDVAVVLRHVPTWQTAGLDAGWATQPRLRRGPFNARLGLALGAVDSP